jgi:hypothetical protein
MTARRLAATVVPLGVAALSLAACGGGQARETGGSCAESLRFNGERYLGTALRLPHGSRVGGGVVPACRADDEDQEVEVVRIDGVPPAVAVTFKGAPADQVFLAPGFFTALPSNPLHSEFDRGAFPRPRRCSGSFSGSGVVARTPTTNDVAVRIDGREIVPRVHLETRIVGFRRAGEPYLQRGDFVRIRGRRCEVPESENGLVVDSIRPAP